MNDNPERSHLLSLSRQLLVAIDTADWETYADLCDENLTAFEPEAAGHLVAGMPFHRFYFELERRSSPQSTISSPQVRVLDDTAVVTYVRLTQRLDADGTPRTACSEETRIWQKQSGRWQHIHFHRSEN